MASTSYDALMTDQRWDDYSSTEHQTWRQLYERQMKILRPRACQQYLDALEILGFTADHIPNFARVNERLCERTGWEVVATDGLIKSRAFFDMLTDRKFPSGRFIRTPEQLDYLEEPDIFHDLFGHIPLLTEPAYADYMHEYGKGGARALEYKTTRHLARLNWWTIEFGLIRSPEGLKIYGAGLLSSFSEGQYCLDDDSAHHIQFHLERCMRTRVYINDMQPCYFVIDSFEDLFKQAVETDFSPMYARFKGLNGMDKAEEFLPFDLQTSDTVLRTGTQTYIKPRRAELEEAISL
ncbi:MAG: phenylalanine 4-monooxygenase [Planctomycetaceae bacterium]|nr:phenylalanine 4-monooxygenase [Planctomycetaceae bacterium]